MRMLVQTYLDSILADIAADRSGTVADYIPELARVEADGFGIAIATSDGHVYETGDTRVPFTIQSISKPFTYGLAIADRGLKQVLGSIDVEPSGDAFNEISLDPERQIPLNPMINAGAITAVSLVEGADPAERFERIRSTLSAFAGRELSMDESVYTSERDTGHRNTAIGYMLRAVGVLEGDPRDVLDVYFRQCALQVTCADLATMAMTLGNGGVCASTSRQVFDADTAQHVLGVMTTCGMYDAAGDWVTTVGMPAKSGVGGGMLAVLPGQVGIAVYSPRLDPHGSSVRGVEACRRLSREMNLHFLNVTRSDRSTVRGTYDVTGNRRPDGSSSDGLRIRVLELHGDLQFSGAETVVRRVTDHADEFDVLVLEVSRVDEVADVARRMLVELQAALREDGKEGVLVDPDQLLPDPDRGIEGRQTRIFSGLAEALDALGADGPRTLQT